MERGGIEANGYTEMTPVAEDELQQSLRPRDLMLGLRQEGTGTDMNGKKGRWIGQLGERSGRNGATI